MTRAEGSERRSGKGAASVAPALEQAIAGKEADLFRLLEVGSGLLGVRMNLDLALTFAEECVRLGPKVDPLAYRMADLPPDEARGASPKEFLSVCGVLAVGARAAAAKESGAR